MVVVCLFSLRVSGMPPLCSVRRRRGRRLFVDSAGAQAAEEACACAERTPPRVSHVRQRIGAGIKDGGGGIRAPSRAEGRSRRMEPSDDRAARHDNNNNNNNINYGQRDSAAAATTKKRDKI